jgi:hypothetical protein
MLGRIILSAVVIIGVFFTMQFINQGVGPAIQDDLAIQQVTDPGVSRTLRAIQDTQNHIGMGVFCTMALLQMVIWRKPFMDGYKKAVAGNTESGCSSGSGCKTESSNTESVKNG